MSDNEVRWQDTVQNLRIAPLIDDAQRDGLAFESAMLHGPHAGALGLQNQRADRQNLASGVFRLLDIYLCGFLKAHCGIGLRERNVHGQFFSDRVSLLPHTGYKSSESLLWPRPQDNQRRLAKPQSRRSEEHT